MTVRRGKSAAATPASPAPREGAADESTSGLTSGLHWIVRGTQPRVCKCGVVVYRLWVWSDKKSHYDAIDHDCESPGSKQPTARVGGTGRIHVCHANEKTA